MRQTTDLATMRAIYAKPKRTSNHESARPLEKIEPESYRQTCSACRRNRDPNCWLCAGKGYVTGNGSARGGTQPAARDVEVESWQDAGLEVVHGATGNSVGRPRHSEANLGPATIRKRKSRPLKDRSETREVFSSKDRARWRRDDAERAIAGQHFAEWDEENQRRWLSVGLLSGVEIWGGQVRDVTNTPTSRRTGPELRFPSLVAVGNPRELTTFLDAYEVYQSELPYETHDFRKGQSPSTADLSAAFARLVDQEPSWTWEPMHAAVERLRPRDRREATARKDHHWLVQALNWRGGSCACDHVDVVAHLAESGSNPDDCVSPAYIARVILDGARRAYDLATSSVAV